MGYAAGVDVGSTQTKAIIVDAERRIVGRSLIPTGANVVTAAEDAFAAALGSAGIGEADVAYVIGTGYGRYKVEFGHAQVTEICCHARGAAEMYPATRTVLDMGGQDTKAIRLQQGGDVLDFCMNDKCAAGTGRFLQSAAAALDIPMERLGDRALAGQRPVNITTTCTVFAESEVLSWLARGKKIEDILAGVHRSIAARSIALLRRVGTEDEITFTGGVARNVAMVAVLHELLGTRLNVSEESHFMGALGAALFALERSAGTEAECGGCRGGRGATGGRRAGRRVLDPGPREGRRCRMRATAGVDVGSTYTKAALVDDSGELLGTGMRPTGFRLEQAAEEALADACAAAGIGRGAVAYLCSTGYGRSQVAQRDVQVTDLTAQAWGTRHFFPATRTVLDVGGQTMKAMRLDELGKVRQFRLNDKCAAGTGAFLEKTARYLGYRMEEIGPLVDGSTEAVPISGVCAVFAESEVINHVSSGCAPADIMHGAMRSLVQRSVQLMKRVQMEPEFTLVGGIMRFGTMVRVMGSQLGAGVNVPPEPLVQFTGALGAAILAGRRMRKLEAEAAVATGP